MATMIELNTVVKRGYYGRVVLRGTNMTVRKGERLRIVGAQGSGRKELMEVIGGIAVPDAGEVLVMDVPLHEITEEQIVEFRRKHIGYVACNPGFWHEFTILENVAMPLTIQGMAREEREEMSLKTLNDVGLSHVVYAFPKSLSVLELRLAGVARALITSPEILLLDNVLFGLNEEEQKKISSLIEKKCSSEHQTVLFFTDNRNETVQVDRTVHIENGTIRREGL